MGSVTGVVLDGAELAVEPEAVEPDDVELEDVESVCDEEPVDCESVAVGSVAVEPVPVEPVPVAPVPVEPCPSTRPRRIRRCGRGVRRRRARGSRSARACSVRAVARRRPAARGRAAVGGVEAEDGSVVDAVGVGVVPEPVSAAAGPASATAQVQRQAPSTARRAADRRSEHTPTFSLPANYTSPENSPKTPDVLVVACFLPPPAAFRQFPALRGSKTSLQSRSKRCTITTMPLGEGEVMRADEGGTGSMVERLRLGRRGLIGAVVLFAVLFGVVGQGAHRAAALDPPPVVSVSGSPDVNEGSPATFTATISPAAAVDFTVSYTASAGGVSGTFAVTTGQTSVDFQVATVDDGVYQSSPRQFTVTLTGTDASDSTSVDGTPATGTLENIDPPPASVVSIGNASAAVTEGSTAHFPVTISPAAGVAFDVSYTATGGGVSGSFHVDQGATSVSVPVATVDNGTPQDDRTMTVTLTGTNASNGSSVDGTPGTGTIIDNDWTITLSPINPGAVSEQGGTIQFTASLNAPAPTQHAISVNYAVNDGSAVRGTNYTVGQANGTLSFAPGASTATVTVTGKDDGVYLAGAGKTFTFALSSPQGATISGSASSTGTINDTDTAPLLGISTCGSGSVNGGAVAVFPIRVQAASVPATVDYTTLPGTTIAGDYDGSSNTITIPPGSSIREYDLKIPTHSIAPAGSRSFSVQLSNPHGARFSTSTVSCTISSAGGGGSSTLPTVQVTNPTPVVEPASGSTSVTVSVKLNAPAAQSPTPGPVNVAWHTVDGTAVAPADYTAVANGTLTWAVNDFSTKTFTVQVNSNPALTAPASFTIAFSSPDASAGFAGSQSATVTVLPIGSTASVLSIADASAPERAGSIPVVVTLTPPGTGPVTVDYKTVDGSGPRAAVAGTDYTAKSGTLTFAPGETTKTISIPITPYSFIQPNKTFQVVLSNASGATITMSTATATILNDNAPLSLPPIATKSPPKPTNPIPIPVQHALTDHLVLVQLLTGDSRADAKGRATYRVSCPDVVIQLCSGTVAFDVRVQAKVPKGSKKKPKLTNMRVGTGTFSVHSGKTGNVVIKLTKPGLKLLLSVKRLRVKATVSAKDGSGVKGVTAWYVSVAAPMPAKKKVAAATTKKKAAAATAKKKVAAPAKK